MKEVNVEKNDLLNTLKRNKEVHAKEFKLIMDEYLLKMIEVYEDGVQQLSQGKIPDPNDIPARPHSHEDDYGKAILMVEMSTDAVINLQEREFSQLVMDEWVWKMEFEMTKSAYGI